MDRATAPEPAGDAPTSARVPTSSERAAALAHLRQRLTADDLSLDTFSDAASAIVNAPTTGDLQQVLATVAPVARMTPPHRRLVEPMVLEIVSGRLELADAWQVARETRVSCQSGRVTLDLSVAEFDSSEVMFDLSCRSGTIDVVVPWSADVTFVRMSGRSGRIENRVASASPPPLPPAVHILVQAETQSGRILFRRPGEVEPVRRRWWQRRRRPQQAA